MRKWLVMLMACLALGLVVAACGDDDDDDDGGGAAEETQQPAPPAGGGGGGGPTEVTMKEIAFDPKDITIKKGDTVTWTNDESVGHDVTKESGPGPDFSSGDPGGMSQGDTYEETFNTAGEIEYVCVVHKGQGMTGTITVE
jgi:plastocyanin